MYGLIYGQGPPALGRALSISPEAAKALIASVHARFPALRGFEERVKHAARCVHAPSFHGSRPPRAHLLHGRDREGRERGLTPHTKRVHTPWPVIGCVRTVLDCSTVDLRDVHLTVIKRACRLFARACRGCGFVQVLSGRRRPILGMNSDAFAARGAGVCVDAVPQRKIRGHPLSVCGGVL